MTDVMTSIQDHPADCLEELLPWRWSPLRLWTRRPDSSLPDRQPLKTVLSDADRESAHRSLTTRLPASLSNRSAIVTLFQFNAIWAPEKFDTFLLSPLFPAGKLREKTVRFLGIIADT